MSHGTSAQAVSLSWALQSGAVVLPRSSNPGRIKGNLRTFVGVERVEVGVEAVVVSRGEEVEAGGGRGDGNGGGSGGGRRAGGDSGGGSGRVEQGCLAGGGGIGPVVEVFLTEEDMGAIDLLDGTIGG